MTSISPPVRYADGVEQPGPDEADPIQAQPQD